MRRILAVAVLLLLLLGVASPAGADTSSRLLTGLVTGAHGLPVGGAQVELIQLGLGTVATAATSDDGTYMLAVAKPAPGPVYLVRVWAKGYALGSSTWLDLDRSADVALTPLTGEIAGSVTDTQGVRVAGAYVELLVGTTIIDSQKTDDAGSYHFDSVPTGTYRVRVLAKGFAPAISGAISAAGGTLNAADVTLQAATGTFAGQVVDQQTGSVLAGAHVLVVRQGVGVVAQGDADASGAFSFAVPPASDPLYRLVVWAAGYTPLQTQPTSLTAGSQVRFVGAGALALNAASGSLGLYVTDAQGFARNSVTVQLDRQGYGTVATASTDKNGHVQFDGVRVGSNYRLRIFPVSSNDQSSQTDWTPVVPGTLTEFSLSQALANANFFGNGTLTGRVVDPAGRPLAGATVDVVRAAGGSTTTVTTDDAGRYTVQVPANKGDWWQTAPGYIVRASAAGYVTSDQFAVPAGRTAPTGGLVDVARSGVAVANLTLYPNVQQLSGYVTDSHGQSIAGVQVHVWQQGAMKPMVIATDAQGRYTLSPGQPDTPFLIYADGAGYLGNLPDGGPAVTANTTMGTLPTLVLNASSALLNVRVTDSLGRAAAGAAVKAFVPVTGEWLTATTDSSGRVDLTQLPVGGQPLAVTVSGDGYSSQALYPLGSSQSVLTLQPLPGDQIRTTTVLQPTQTTVGGTVLAGGTPVAGATVSLMQEGVGVVATLQTDSGGHYWFRGVAATPGVRYAVRAEAQGYVTTSMLRGGKLMSPVLPDPGGTIRLDLVLSPTP